MIFTAVGIKSFRNVIGTNRGTLSSTIKINFSSGALADVCNLHIVSSPFPPILDVSNFSPVPQFLSTQWISPPLKNKVAIRDGSTGETRTFLDYYNRMNSIASALKYDYNLRANETVALFSPNNVDYLPISLAVAICGAKITPLNPLYTVHEVSTVLDRSVSRIIFSHAKLLPVAIEAAAKCKCVEHIVVLPNVDRDTHLPVGTTSFQELVEYSHSLPHVNFFDEMQIQSKDLNNYPWLLPYSSGTTGFPKGVCLSHGNIIANLLQLHEVEKAVFPISHKLMSPLPFFHIYGFLASLIYCGWQGHELITMSDRFDLEKFCELIQEHKPERSHLVPPIILGLAKHPIVDKYNLSSLKMIVSGAAPLGKETQDSVKARLNIELKQSWGMSELSPIGTINSDYNSKTGSIGPLVSSTFGKILDIQSGKSLGPNQPGELVIKGPQVMMGYLNDTVSTSLCISSGKWLRTGDMAYYDEDGFFYITDRIKELIKVRGFPVAPAELEELMLTNDFVQDVAVVSTPDEVSGELPRAYVVLKASIDPKIITEQYLKGWVKERVSPHKRLDGGVVFVDQIPKSASGKILRRVLRDLEKNSFN